MGSWPTRFEDVIAEIEGEIPPTEERIKNLRDLLSASLWEEIRDLSTQFKNGTINQVKFDQEFQKINDLYQRFENAITKVNFYENI